MASAISGPNGRKVGLFGVGMGSFLGKHIITASKIYFKTPGDEG